VLDAITYPRVGDGLYEMKGVLSRKKQVLPYLRQFTVMAAAVADGTGNATLQISPAIIAPAAFPNGAFTTVSAAPAAGAVVTWMGAANTPYTQLFLTHIDENGDDSPPVLLERFGRNPK